jgi:hypothetical protein
MGAACATGRNEDVPEVPRENRGGAAPAHRSPPPALEAVLPSDRATPDELQSPDDSNGADDPMHPMLLRSESDPQLLARSRSGTAGASTSLLGGGGRQDSVVSHRSVLMMEGVKLGMSDLTQRRALDSSDEANNVLRAPSTSPPAVSPPAKSMSPPGRADDDLLNTFGPGDEMHQEAAPSTPTVTVTEPVPAPWQPVGQPAAPPATAAHRNSAHLAFAALQDDFLVGDLDTLDGVTSGDNSVAHAKPPPANNISRNSSSAQMLGSGRGMSGLQANYSVQSEAQDMDAGSGLVGLGGFLSGLGVPMATSGGDENIGQSTVTGTFASGAFVAGSAAEADGLNRNVTPQAREPVKLHFAGWETVPVQPGSASVSPRDVEISPSEGKKKKAHFAEPGS